MGVSNSGIDDLGELIGCSMCIKVKHIGGHAVVSADDIAVVGLGGSAVCNLADFAQRISQVINTIRSRGVVVVDIHVGTVGSVVAVPGDATLDKVQLISHLL